MKKKIFKLLSVTAFPIVALSAGCSSKKSSEEKYLDELIKISETTVNKLRPFTNDENSFKEQNLQSITNLEQEINASKAVIAKKDHTKEEVINSTEKLLVKVKIAQQYLEIETLVNNLLTFKNVFKSSKEQNPEAKEKYDKYIQKIDEAVANRDIAELRKLDKEIKELALV
ncbi:MULTISPECIES: hypothetical protein [unclassified Mycoplasma]|uniref:hypothetical protein n=1 Tax=unclassified Mycoplasma TaxID=2683645 RepID=UPI00216B003E|nr:MULTISPECIES: hypothetical protein [unclassified Mycoplasma]MCS4536722.1 hypothetical protein [Mycoplasma sp. CSL7475-4]MCT4469742.1 hypothetical protein [Mycoplasma sp. HS2188]